MNTSCITANRAHPTRLACLAAACLIILCLVGGALLHGQVPSDSTPTQDAQSQAGYGSSTAPQDSSDSSRIGLNPSAGSSTAPVRAALSAGQITDILQQNPDLLLELKSQLSDRLQQQGVQIDAGEISDQTLYNQIATNADLRGNITTVLRARGYVSDDDLQSAASNVTPQDRISSDSSAQESRLPRDSSSGAATDTGSQTIHVPLAATPGLAGLGENRTSRRQEATNASTDPPRVHHQTAPYDLPSMHDLYTQVSDEGVGLRRFGSDVFAKRESSAIAHGASPGDASLDVPIGPDYIVGPGDTLTIHLWGGMTQSIVRTVNRDGSIFLPEAGSIDVAGLPLGKAQTVIEEALKAQYRNAHVAVSVSQLRSVRIYLVGDVQRPGGYDISSLSTPVSALYTAGGPSGTGSLRTMLHYRGKQLVENIDLYDFLLHGIRNGSAPFESGDTLLVPPAGSLVAIFGAVKRPAIYELRAGETTLATVVSDAGGFTAAASLGNITIERIDAHHERETVTLRGSGDPGSSSDGDIDKFSVKDGDRIRIGPILPYSQRAIYLAGHVVRPGRLAYADGMRLSDVLHSYQDMLPEPGAHGEIVRLVPPDLHAETIDFNVPDVLIGNTNVELRPFDTVRVFGRYQVDAPMVTIRGEVMRPGRYPMSQSMTAAQLVRMAGGFKRDALTESADLTSYEVRNGNQVVESLASVQIGAAVSGADEHADVLLKPSDTLAIHQITNWENIGESITIDGEVRYPGSYGFQDGERLSSVLRRAGGLLSTAYPAGAVLIRAQVRELEQKSRDELIRQIETSSAAARLSPSVSGGNSTSALQAIKEQQNEVLADLKQHPPNGRMVIHISADLDSWANTPADIELRRGDELTIPKQPGFVLVSGQVYNATALTFTPGKTASWYLQHAGGTSAAANRKEIFIVRANGSVVGRRSGSWLQSEVLSTRLMPGDVVVVPQKVIGGSLFWRSLLTTAQVASSIAITSGVAAATL